VVKLALIYVAPGQDNESTLLKNNTSSEEYQEFVASLGWQVELDKHHGFKGGLEGSMMVDGTATYFCTSTQEIIFHDVTRMITEQTDPRQLKKKRHIGTDD
jgi:Rap/ran-GAP